MTWNVLAIYPNHEAQAERQLKRQRFRIYLPRCKHYHRRGRDRAGPIYLWPGYMLIQLDEVWPSENDLMAAWRAVLDTPGVADVLKLAEEDFHPAQLDDDYVASVRRLEGIDGLIMLRNRRPPKFIRDQMVKVVNRSSIFWDHQDFRVVSEDPGRRVTALKEMLGNLVKVEFAPEELEAVA